MSFDNVYDRFEYVRWGSSWERFDKNVKTVVDRVKNSGQHCGIQAVYTIYNCTRLCELKEYAMKNNNLNICWQHVWGDQIDPQQHNEKVRKLAIEELIRYRDNFPLRPIEIDFVKQQLDKLQNDVSDVKEDFTKFTDDVENKWHPDQKGQFKKLWPELAEVLW